jgi:hypothetical protein
MLECLPDFVIPVRTGTDGQAGVNVRMTTKKGLSIESNEKGQLNSHPFKC